MPMLLPPHRVFALMLVLWIAGCANATVADRPMRVASEPTEQSPKGQLRINTAFVSDFEGSLTKAERNAVISSLLNDRERALLAAQR